METNSRPLVLFHDQCVDGIVAAWVVWRRYFDRADYVAVRYGQPAPDCTDRLVFIVDFCYPPAETTRIADQARRVIIIDHHATAIEAFERDWKPRNDVEVLFDLERSGAQLTASYFNATARMWIIDYAEDHDLWRHQLPDTKEVNALIACVCLGHDPIHAFRALEELRGTSIKAAVTLGKGARLQVECFARQVALEVSRVVFAGHPGIPMVNMAKPFTSEVLHLLDQSASFAVGWRMEGGVVVFSLRSSGEPPFNVAELCAQFGGGGHRAAAGFALPLDAHDTWAKAFPDGNPLLPRRADA